LTTGDQFVMHSTRCRFYALGQYIRCLFVVHACLIVANLSTFI